MTCFASAFNFLRQCAADLCGFRRAKPPSSENEELLGYKPDASLGANNVRQQHLLVMRHGLRQDEVDPNFTRRSSRPWDPPLASRGRNQAASVISVLAPYNIDYIVTSPFLRCLQTSAEILVGLGLDLDHLIVDGQFSEIYGPRTLSGFDPCRATSSLESWMWNGVSLNDAVKSYIQNEPCFCGLQGSVTVLNRPLPKRVESVEQACDRYVQEMENVCDQFFGSNVLVVSHGEAVRASVNRLSPDSTVYETKHTSFTTASRNITVESDGFGNLDRASVSFTTSRWRLLTKNGTTGVSWVD